jgi:Fe-S cluster biogenesis protein NfuA
VFPIGGPPSLRSLDPPYAGKSYPMTPHELKDRIAQVIAEEIGPALDLDGSAIEVIDVEGGVVQVRLNGACAGCPSSVMTLIMGLEHELRHRVPEVEYLEAVP